MHGYERSELMGSHVFTAIAPESRDYVMAKARARYFGAYEAMSMKKDGDVFPVEIHAREIPFQGKLVRAAAVRDLTERKRAEEEIKRREEFLKAIVENIPAIVVVKDARDLRVLRVNKSAEDSIGYSRDEMVGRALYDLFEKDLADSFMRNDRSVLETGVPGRHSRGEDSDQTRRREDLAHEEYPDLRRTGYTTVSTDPLPGHNRTEAWRESPRRERETLPAALQQHRRCSFRPRRA